MELFVMGTSQAVASARTRERMHVDLDEVYAALRALRDERHVLVEAIPLTTCGRLELYGLAPNVGRAVGVLGGLVARRTGMERSKITEHTYVHRGRDAVRHLFRVAAGLDSVVYGEAQILGQVRDAAHDPRVGSVEGPTLHRLFRFALRAGKRVRSETQIGRGAASVAGASLTVLGREVGPLGAVTALVLGAGDTGTLIARLLHKAGVGRLIVTNRTFSSSARIASELGCEAYGLDQMMQLLPQVDLVVGAVAASEPLLTADALRGVIGGPRYFLDLAHPRTFDPALAELPDVRVFDLEHVFERVEAARETRAAEIPRAEAIVDEEAQNFLSWLRTRENAPILKAVRDQALTRALAEADRYADGAAVEQRQEMRRLARSVTRAILHQPTVAIRHADPETRKGRALLESVTALFGVDGPDPSID